MTVCISLSNVPGKETLAYVLLDTQSSNTFVDQEVCEKLKEEPLRLRLSTMVGRDSIAPA